MRVTWRSIEWLNEDYRSRIEARLDAMAGEGGGADRVEVVSRTLGSGEAACTEVRIAGVIKKCQLTAVREHHAPERALNDALDAFERNVAYALTAQPPARSRDAVPAMGVAAMSGSASAVISPIERLTDSVQGVLQPVGSLLDRVRDVRGASTRASKQRAAARTVAPSARSKRRGSSGFFRQVLVGSGVFVVVGSGLWWYQGGSLEDSVALPTAVAETLGRVGAPAQDAAVAAPMAASEPEEAIAFWAVASVDAADEVAPVASFSAVARAGSRFEP